MAQPQKAKPPPLDILQSMVNGILIEIGRALRTTDKEHGRTFSSSSTRLQTTIPSAANNFHQALDDLEIDILRAKAVILRDLEKQRAERIAREAPVKAPEPEVIPEPTSSPAAPQIVQSTNSTESIPKDQIKVPPAPTSTPMKAPQPTPTMVNPPQSPTMQKTKSQQAPTPPPSNIPNSKPIGLGIDTEALANPPTAQETSGVPNSSVDSLFDIPDNENDDSILNFDDMDFSADASVNQNPDQAQNNDFDLLTFGNDTQDFGMLDVPAEEGNNATANTTDKIDDLFDDLGTNTGGDNMDLELGNMDMGEGNSFDDLFLVGDGDDGNLGDGEMEHGQFDRAFFGLD